MKVKITGSFVKPSIVEYILPIMSIVKYLHIATMIEIIKTVIATWKQCNGVGHSPASEMRPGYKIPAVETLSLSILI